MLKLLILDSWRLSTKISEFGCWISLHGESRWQELFLDGNKSYQILPQEKLDVSLRQNQPISAFFDGSQCFWYAVAVARSDYFEHLCFLMFVPPRYENKLQLISVSFPKNLLSRGIPVRNDVLDLDIQLLEDFFVLNQWKGLLAWTGSFRIFGDNLWAAVSNVEASNTRLVKTFHQDFLIWLLNLSSWRKSLTRTVFGCEQVISNLASRKVGCLLAAKPTNLSLLWWLSMFLVRRCCCSQWLFWTSVFPDVRTTKIWKQVAAHFSFFSQKFAVSRNSSSKWCFGSWYSTSWGFLCFESMKRSSCLDWEFSYFGDNLWAAVSNVEASNTRLVKTFHQDFLIWLLNLSSWRKSLTRTVFWWEKSYQTLLLKKKLDVALRQNQLISAFFDGSQCFWYAVAVARSDGFVHLWLLMFVPPRSGNKLQLISVSFPKNLLSRGIPVRNDVLDLDIQLLEDFFVLNQWKGLLAWTGSFRIFGDNLWAAVSNVEASNTRLVKTFHQDFLIWLLNLSSWRKYLTRTVFWWEKSYQTLLLKNDWMSPCGNSTNLSLLWWLSMFLVRRCCCSQWLFWTSLFPDVRTTKIWKQVAAHFSFFSQKFAVSRNSSSKWCFGSWYSTSWGFLCFESMKRSSCLDWEFSYFWR